MKLLSILRAALVLTGILPHLLMADSLPLYIGTNTAKPDQPGSRGVYFSTLETDSGQLAPAVLAGEVASPTFLAIHPTQPWLYTASEVYGPKGGTITAWRIESDGKLTEINAVPSGGRGACHVSIDAENGIVLAANFGGPSIASFKIKADGGLEPVSVVERSGSGPDPKAQTKSKPHSIYPHPTAPLAINADLGTDEISLYQLDPATGELSDQPAASVKVANPGAGPRHLAITPNGRRIYLLNELDATISLFDVDPDAPALTEVGQVKIGDADATWGSEIRFHPTGRYLYAAARHPGTITAYQLDPQTGDLTPIQTIDAGGKIQRNFEVDPTGQYLLVANNESNNIASFRIDPETGQLTRHPEGDLTLDRPAVIRFQPLPQP